MPLLLLLLLPLLLLPYSRSESEWSEDPVVVDVDVVLAVLRCLRINAANKRHNASNTPAECNARTLEWLINMSEALASTMMVHTEDAS